MIYILIHHYHGIINLYYSSFCLSEIIRGYVRIRSSEGFSIQKLLLEAENIPYLKIRDKKIEFDEVSPDYPSTYVFINIIK